MLITITLLLIRQYRRAGSRRAFFNWLLSVVSGHTPRMMRFSTIFVLIAVLLKA